MNSVLDVNDWNTQDAEILKAKYQIAVDKKEEFFMLMGQPVLVSYCMYLIEHLENQGVLSKN